MNQTVTASFTELFQQSRSTAEEYFLYAKSVLVESGMKHTAADVIALAQIMAYDFRTSSMLIAAQKIAGVIETSVSEVAENIDGVEFSIDMLRDIIESRKDV
jgi:predicted nucleotide-binding protein